MTRSDKTTTCPTCGGTFQLRGAGSHFLACAERAGKPAPPPPRAAPAPAPKPATPEPGPKAPTLPTEPARGRGEGRPRFHDWKGGARG